MSDRDTDFASNLTNPEMWIRLGFMILFAAAFYIATWIGAAVALIQFGSGLITGKPMPRLTAFGTSLGRFLGQIATFEMFGSNQRPWPFSPWPSGAPGAAQPPGRTNRTRVVKTAGRQAQDEHRE